MIFTAVILFFLMGVVAIYALIQTGKNYALQAVLIPVILVGTLFAGYAIYILQGTPKQGIPEYDVEVVFVQLAVSVASYGFLIRSLNGFERGVYAFVALFGFLGFTYDANFWYVAVALFAAISVYVFVSSKTQN